MKDLPQADRFADERSTSPYWNESVWFSISKPEERLHGFVQYNPQQSPPNDRTVAQGPGTAFDTLRARYSGPV